jgi:LmbE family N-acetylglucosaminyl deacetylase
MLQFLLPQIRDREFRILCLGAHADDIEIGCGGTLLRLTQSLPNLHVYWLVFSSEGIRKKEAKTSADQFLHKAGKKSISIKGFRGSFFPFQGRAIKQCFEALKEAYQPDLIFTHYRHDLHQDHRIINEFTWNTYRNHMILEYEIPKYDGDMGSPNVFVPIDRAAARRKIWLLLKCFKSQASKAWFTEDTFWSLMRLRGVECNASSKLAEAYYCRKLTL